MSTIQFDDFAKLDIRIATVTAVTVVENADKLLQLTLDVGELGERTVVSGIREWYAPEDLLDRQVAYLANLEPRTFRGVESQGMILAGDDGTAVLLRPVKPLPPGTLVR
ncbi:MAG: hypothetical protein WDZ94_02825 [Patescibacteria group bacterium]